MSRPAIQDEFTALPVSSQRKVQLRWHRDGRCQKCGEPIVTAFHCLKHAIQHREQQRRRKGSKGEYASLTRRLEKIPPHNSHSSHNSL